MNVDEKKIRLHRAQIGHYLQAERYARLHYLLGLPLIVLAGITNIGVLYKVDFSKIDFAMILILISTLLVTLLSSLQTFLNYSEKSELHRSMAVKYGKLKRDIEHLIEIDLQKEEKEKYLKKIYNEWNYITEIAPVTPRNIKIKAEEIQQKKTD